MDNASQVVTRSVTGWLWAHAYAAVRPAVALAVFAGALALPVAGAGLEFYVAPGGDDANPGTLESPFASLPRAMKAVRDLGLAKTDPGPVTVSLRGGRYELRERLHFGPEDTGTATSPVTYRSFPGERAVLSGGRQITGAWRQSEGKPYWELSIPDAANAGWLFNSLYVNEMSRDRARQPNWGEKVLRAEGRAPGEDEKQAFSYYAGDIDPAWTDLTNIDIVLLGSWTPTLHKIQEVMPDRRVVRFHSTCFRTVDAYEKNFRYYLANVFEALDAPGEWYLNRQTGVLYYYPLPGEDMATAEVIAPVLKSRIIEFVGDVTNDRFIEHLRFMDLDIRHVDGDLARYNGVYRQGHMFLDAAVYAEGLRSSQFTNCELAQLGEYAMELTSGCRDNRIEHCHIWDLGAGAMQIGVTDLGALLAGCARVLPGDVAVEAEEAEVVAPMVVEADSAASKGRYVVLPAGQEGGQARFAVEAAEAGRYRLLARVQAPSGSADSFLVQVNDGPTYTYDTGVNTAWFLSPVMARELGGKPLDAELRQGRNTVVVSGREPGAKLDQLMVRRQRDGVTPESERAAVEVLSNAIDNNYIHRLGTIWHGCYGIVNRFASFTKITHNEISDTHWDPIGLDARWNYAGETYSHGNEVAYNHLHHLGLGYHTDAGGVYQFGPLDTHIHHNLIHDARAYPYICGFTGVYLDEQSRGALVENNLVYNVDWSAYFQHKGVDNVFRNNIGAFARDGFIFRGGLNEQWKTNTFEVYRNIYIAKDNIAIRNNWDPGEVLPILRENMYFSTTTGADLTFAGKSLAEWQVQGNDVGSVLADPGCTAPANLDFSLTPDAAAVTRIGFVPFDEEIRKAGRHGDTAWLDFAVKYPPRTVSTAWTPEELVRLQFFSLDFENMPDGCEPPQFHLAREGEATFAVTSEAACGGNKSLKCVDRKGLKKPFYPYIHVAPRRLDKGRITFAFDAMNSKDTSAHFYVECRGKGDPFEVGPSLQFNTDGKVVANGRDVLAVEPGTWCRIEVAFELGGAPPREYTLLTRCGGVENRQSVPFTNATFRELAWFGIAAADDADGVFYLDNLTFRLE